MPGEFEDAFQGFSSIYAPALQASTSALITSTGSAAGAMGAAWAAAGPLAIGMAVFSAISGRRKRKRRRRQAARVLAAKRVEARGAARGVGVKGQQAVGQVVASGTQFGGTMAAGMSQGVMGNVFLEQQRTMQRVGLGVKSMAKARDKAIKRAAWRKANAERSRKRTWNKPTQEEWKKANANN